MLQSSITHEIWYPCPQCHMPQYPHHGSCLILQLLLVYLFGISGSSLLSNMRFAPVNFVLHLLHHFLDFSVPWIRTELFAFHVETNRERNGCQFQRKKVKIPAFKNHNYHSPMKTTKLDLVNLKFYFMQCLLIIYLVSNTLGSKFYMIKLTFQSLKKGFTTSMQKEPLCKATKYFCGQ